MLQTSPGRGFVSPSPSLTVCRSIGDGADTIVVACRTTRTSLLARDASVPGFTDTYWSPRCVPRAATINATLGRTFDKFTSFSFKAGFTFALFVYASAPVAAGFRARILLVKN